MAGPDLGPRSFSAAVIPDGPNCQWRGGEFERIEAENRARLKKHFANLAKNCLYQRDTPPTNLLGGYKFPGAPTAADLGRVNTTEPSEPARPLIVNATKVAQLIATIPADLEIPPFLDRRVSAETAL